MDKQLQDYNLMCENIKLLLADIKAHPQDKFLKSQLKACREYKKELRIKLELRGVRVR